MKKLFALLKSETNAFLFKKIPSWNVKELPLVIGLLSLFWLLYKTGTKPSRASYPCQKASATYVSIFLWPSVIMAVYKALRIKKTINIKKFFWCCDYCGCRIFFNINVRMGCRLYQKPKSNEAI